MAIAETGNRIIDAQARLGKARADAEDRKKSRVAKRGSKSRMTRGKTNEKARSGRASGRSGRGRGIAGQVHRSRAGAGKSIDYALNKKDAKFISSNAGLTAKDITVSFRLAAAGRRDIIKNTAHESFSLPAGQKLSDEKWADVIDLVRKEKGLDDGFPYACGLHDDTDNQHIHFVYSRVSYDGRVVDDRFSKVRVAAIEDMIEDKFNLKLVPKLPKPTAPPYSKNESEMAQRTGMKPPRFVMFDAIEKAKKDKPDAMTFIERLKADRITARPAIKNGRMSGFSFSYKNVELGASKIHNSLGWANLKNGIDYDSDRDDQKLTKHSASLDPRAKTEQPEPIATDREIPALGATLERPAGRAEVAEASAGNGTGKDEAKPFIPSRRAGILEVPTTSPLVDNGIVDANPDGIPDDGVTRIKKTPEEIRKMLAELKAKRDDLMDTPDRFKKALADWHEPTDQDDYHLPSM